MNIDDQLHLHRLDRQRQEIAESNLRREAALRRLIAEQPSNSPTARLTMRARAARNTRREQRRLRHHYRTERIGLPPYPLFGSVLHNRDRKVVAHLFEPQFFDIGDEVQIRRQFPRDWKPVLARLVDQRGAKATYLIDRDTPATFKRRDILTVDPMPYKPPARAESEVTQQHKGAKK